MTDERRPLHDDGEILADWTDWLLLVEDDGPNGLGRVVGYFVFRTEADAWRCNRLGALMDALGMHIGEDIPGRRVPDGDHDVRRLQGVVRQPHAAQ